MIRVSVAIMAHRKRKAFIPELEAKLDRPAQVVLDRKNDRWETGRRAMLAYEKAATHHLVVQDDAVIPRDLVAGIEQALAHVPDGAPLCLYCGRTRPYRELVGRLVATAGPGTSWLTMGQLHWGVGIAMPTKWIDEMVTWCDKRTEIANYDRRISRWCQHKGLTVWYPWPSVVDHRDSPSLVPGRGSAGRRAHQFIGADASALDLRWDGRVVTIPALNVPETAPPPGEIGAPPVQFVSLKYPNLSVPTINVRFRPTVATDGAAVGVAEVHSPRAIAHLQSPWMRRRGVRLAAEVDLTPVSAAQTGRRPAAPAEPEAAQPVAEDTPSVDQQPDTDPTPVALGGPPPDERPAPPPVSGRGSGVAAWQEYAARVTGKPQEAFAAMGRQDIIDMLRSDGVLPPEPAQSEG